MDGLLHRSRLIAPLLVGRRTALVEAGAGFGKSTLLDQAVVSSSEPYLWVSLPRRRVCEVPDVTVAICAAAGRAGLAGFASVVAADASVVDIGSALERADSPTVVIDNAQALSPSGAGFVADLVELARPSRFLIGGRAMPRALAALELEMGATRLGSDLLRLDEDEAQALAVTHLGEVNGSAVGPPLLAACGGWIMVFTLALRRLSMLEDPLAMAEELMYRSGVLSEALAYYVADLDPNDQRLLIQVAHLPEVHVEVLDALGGDGLLERAQHAGIPFTRRPDGWWRLPSAIAEYLRVQAPLDEATALAAAPVMVRRRLITPACEVLIEAGHLDAAVDILATQTVSRMDSLESYSITRLFSMLGDAAERRPRSLFHFARALGRSGDVAGHRRVLERIAAIADTLDGPDGARLGEDAEAALILWEAARTEATEHLDRLEAITRSDLAGPHARADAYTALGATWSERLDLASLRAADDAFRRAIALFESIDEPSLAASAKRGLTVRVLLRLGDYRQADNVLTELRGRMGANAFERTICAVLRLRVLAKSGQLDELDTAIAEDSDSIRALGEPWMVGHLSWSAAHLAAARGDTAQARSRLFDAETGLGQVLTAGVGALFHCEASRLLAYAGDADGAQERLARARDLADCAGPWLPLTEATFHARFDDPSVALEQTEGLVVAPAEEWQVHLLRAEAHHRLGDRDPADAELRRCFEAAATIGWPDLPRVLASSVVEPLGQQVSQVTVSPAPTGRTLVRILGHFEIVIDGEPATPSPGQPTTLMSHLALAGGRLPAEVVIDRLWPDESLEIGRTRLKNILSRVRRAWGPVVERSGLLVCLADEVSVDLFEFEARARRVALADSPSERTALAHEALEMVRGPLLEDQPYDDIVIGRRVDVAERILGLVDVLLSGEPGQQDLDRAMLIIELLSESNPAMASRQVQMARALIDGGRQADARRMLTMAERAHVETGIDVPQVIADLRSVLDL